VDKDHIGIWGWSFGGFNTLMSMSEGRPVFAAGVAVAPPTSWRYYDSVYTERFMRTPKENGDGYDVSPIGRASQLHGHLLICQGTADDNVHYRNVAEYTEALVQADRISVSSPIPIAIITLAVAIRECIFSVRLHSTLNNICSKRVF
jgi:dipeptidyl-peptidase-4